MRGEMRHSQGKKTSRAFKKLYNGMQLTNNWRRH